MKISFVQRLLSTAEGCHLGHSTIDSLSDDVLLCIFDSYRRDLECGGMWPWGDLVHVCQRWRHVVFAYPGYLDLRLRCKSKTDVRATLDIWPTLPLSIHAILYHKDVDEDDLIGALEHRDRITGIDLGGFKCSQLTKCMALMQEPFPVLKSLELRADDNTMIVITDTFLGGSAPLLQTIRLHGIRFPSLPRLLLSTNDLVNLDLSAFALRSGEGDIPPDALITCLSLLTKLRSLTLTLLHRWGTAIPYPTDQHPPFSTHAVLPALIYLSLRGPHQYLEDFVGRVDAPLLTSGDLQFWESWDEPMFVTPRVPQFIHRTEMFKFVREIEMHLCCARPYRRPGIDATFHSSICPAKFSLSSPCSSSHTHCAIIEQICAQWPPLISHIEVLTSYDDFSQESRYSDSVIITPWSGCLRPFTAVQTLRLHAIAKGPPYVSYVLGRLEGGSATEVLPALRTIELYCSEQGTTEALCLLTPFLVAREESECPVAVNVNSKS